jgi:hypothetical protein
MTQIEEHFIQKSLSYAAYFELNKKLVAQHKTTGSEQTEELINFTKLNLQRMQRLSKTAFLTAELSEIIEKWTSPLTILVITEAWCGDAAQQLPWFQKLSELNPLIQVRTILRDENPDLMNRYLTNGVSKSIPVVLLLNENKQQLFRWGPRSSELQNLMQIWNAENLVKAEKLIKIHTWYAQNKGIDLQKELVSIFKNHLKWT